MEDKEKDLKAPEDGVENKDEQKPNEAEKKEEEKAEDGKKEETKAEDKKPENKDGEEAKVDVQALKQELAEANAKAQEVETLTVEVGNLEKEVSEKDAVIKEYEELLGDMVETKMNQVPADLKDLIPDNMDLKQKLAWLEKAESKGIFNKEKKKPDVEVGKPMNVDAPQVDTSKMSAGQLLKLAYSTTKKQ